MSGLQKSLVQTCERCSKHRDDTHHEISGTRWAPSSTRSSDARSANTGRRSARRKLPHKKNVRCTRRAHRPPIHHEDSTHLLGRASSTSSTRTGNLKTVLAHWRLDKTSAIVEATPGVCVTTSDPKAASPKSSASSHASCIKAGVEPLRRMIKLRAVMLSALTSSCTRSKGHCCFHVRSATSRLMDSATCWHFSFPIGSFKSRLLHM